MHSVTSAERVIEDLRVELFRRRISQDRIATATGMSQSGVSRRLNGEVSPTIAEVEAIASAAGLGIHVELVELDHRPASATPADADAGAPDPNYGAPATPAGSNA